jgi:hypothetical protein
MGRGEEGLLANYWKGELVAPLSLVLLFRFLLEKVVAASYRLVYPVESA